MDNIVLKALLIVVIYFICEFAYMKYKQHRSLSTVIRTRGRPISFKKVE